MELQCRMSKKTQLFCLNFRKPLWASSSEAERERERRQVFKGKERQLRIGERGKRETEWSKTKSPRRAGPPAPPHNRLSIHGIENWVPGISFYVGSPVFVHSFPWATIFFFDFEGFPHPLVIVKFSLVLSRHGLDDLEV